ncbi:MAG: hypothetical protein LBF71_05380 [Campylobacteraceae bacterium]|jgi:hypothetical protein|nr:hypothetical protein [Campylobacteraceae bacterium]
MKLTQTEKYPILEKFYLSIDDITFLFNFSATAWREMVSAGKAPSPTIKKHKYVVWKKDDIIEFSKKWESGIVDF